jgi:hypothetical protein
MPSRAAKIADFVRNLAEGVLLRFGEVAFAAFAIDVDEVDGFVFRNVKINHPRATALADANGGKAHAGFAESTASTHDIALLRLSSKVELEVGIVIIGKTKNNLGVVCFVKGRAVSSAKRPGKSLLKEDFISLPGGELVGTAQLTAP